jgi:hypothetical protein
MINAHCFGIITLNGVFRTVAMGDAFWRASPTGVKAALEGGNLTVFLS